MSTADPTINETIGLDLKTSVTFSTDFEQTFTRGIIFTPINTWSYPNSLDGGFD